MRQDLPSAYAVSKLLTQFDHGHYDHFALHARICRKLGKTEEAKKNYKIAIQICKADPNWDKNRRPNAPLIGEIIRSIEYELQEITD